MAFFYVTILENCGKVGAGGDVAMPLEKQDGLKEGPDKTHRLEINTNPDAINQAHLSDISSLAKHACESLARIASDSMSLSLDVALPTVNYQTDFLKRLLGSCMSLPLSDLKEAVASMFEQIIDQATLDFSLQDSLVDLITHAIEVSIPYIPKQQQPEYQDELILKLSEHTSKRFTPSDLLGLFNLLISVLAIVLTLMPDPQLDKIAAQNERLIEVEEERLNLERERADQFDDVVQALTDAIIPLYNQIEDLSNLPQDSDNPDISDRQEADCDTLDGQSNDNQ